jgi:hypothetical protein
MVARVCLPLQLQLSEKGRTGQCVLLLVCCASECRCDTPASAPFSDNMAFAVYTALVHAYRVLVCGTASLHVQR